MTDYASYTDIGDRQTNEDGFGIGKQNGKELFVVADGLGGHGQGEVASETAVRAAMEAFYGDDSGSPKDILERCMQHAQDQVMERVRQGTDLSAIKTTLVCALLVDKELWISHIGDSRCYLFRKHKIIYQTLDHSVCQMLVLSKRLKQSEIRHHPDRNRLLRVIGIDWNDVPQYETVKQPLRLKTGDRILLCTDGFWEPIDEESMIQCMKQTTTAAEWLSGMVERIWANPVESRDNCTAIAICM